MKKTLDGHALKLFQREMSEREYAPATQRKYTHTLELLLTYAGGKVTRKETLIGFKTYMRKKIMSTKDHSS